MDVYHQILRRLEIRTPNNLGNSGQRLKFISRIHLSVVLCLLFKYIIQGDRSLNELTGFPRVTQDHTYNIKVERFFNVSNKRFDSIYKQKREIISRFRNPKKYEIGGKQQLEVRNIGDKELLKKFETFAHYASLGYCLNKDEGDSIAPEINARVVWFENQHKQSELIIYFGARVLNRNEWLKRHWNLIKYPLIEHGSIDEEFLSETATGVKGLKDKILKSREWIEIKKILRINLVGHGLAGVFAVLLQPYLQLMFSHAEYYVYTYGQPRIGDKDFARALSLQKKLFIYRITHADDYVPRMPLKLSFSHHPSEFWIEADCECKIEKVYMCWGPIFSRGYEEESQLCNNQYNKFEDLLHEGYYFKKYMGKCPEDRSHPNPDLDLKF
ncbi:hypothetical protein G9A89_008953 [Geosiphon pyriformis]|nr:hypothetical protein G9A89_008953 [Geosiphon pyriformis]